MLVPPFKPTLKAPETKRLKLSYDNCFQICFKFASKINLRRYDVVQRQALTKTNASGSFASPGRAVQVDPIKPHALSDYDINA